MDNISTSVKVLVVRNEYDQLASLNSIRNYFFVWDITPPHE